MRPQWSRAAVRGFATTLAAVTILAAATVGAVPGVPNVAAASPLRPPDGSGFSSPAQQAAGTGSGPIVVDAQSPWVMAGQDFQMHLLINSANPSTDKVVVQAFSRLTTRSDFEAALSGRVQGGIRYPPVVMPLAQLHPDAQGGYDINIPVNPSGSTPQGPGTFPAFSALGGSGVFPLQVGLYSADGVPEGRMLTTFLVFGAGQGSEVGLPKLNVALVIPFRAPPSIGPHGTVGDLAPAELARLQQLVGALQAHDDVPVSLAVSPRTVDALGSGSAVDRSTVASLASTERAGGDEVLGSTYARVSIDDLVGSGLASELADQFSEGSAALAKAFGTAPSTSTWVFDGPVDQTSANSVLSRGATHLIVPDAYLSPLPNAARQTTFALPTHLSGVGRGVGPSVYGADTLLSGDFNDSGGPVLAADHLLAELAMIQVETPGINRGVAVVPPHQWSADPTFINTLLAGLSGHPLLQAVTASGLFSAVKVAEVQRSLAAPSSNGNGPGPGSGYGSSEVTGASTPAAPPAGLGQDAAAIRDARRRVQAYGAVFASDQEAAEELGDALLVAESTDVSEAQRRAILGAVRNGSAGLLKDVTLPRSSSITLTSTRGQIPLTILSVGGIQAKVELRLSSQRLIFRPFNPPGGYCRVPTPTSETCELVVSGQNTTLKVPVEARSSGVFPVDVSLWTPGGGIRLAKEQNTVRSTAVSGVGVVLIVLTVLSLAVWWGRDLRHGRRARRLVPAPHEDEPELQLDDPVVSEFFANPPPGYGG